MATINQKIIVLCLNVVLIAGTLGFDWVDTLFPSAEAHAVPAHLQSRFIRIEGETLNRQSLQTGEVLILTGQLVSLVERDLRVWISIFSESANTTHRWEVIAKDPPDNILNISGNTVVDYSISAIALEEGVHHVHTQFNVAAGGPGLGPGQTVVVEGEPITKPALFDSTAMIYAVAALAATGGVLFAILRHSARKKGESTGVAPGSAVNVFGRFFWHYPAKKAGMWLMFFGVFLVCLWVLRVVMDLDRGQPDYYHLGAYLTTVGIGCAMLVYHTLKNNEEDTAAKKRIVLVGVAVGSLMVTLSILSRYYA